jgi:hypothetical protein
MSKLEIADRSLDTESAEPERFERGCVLFVAYHFAPENAAGTHRSLHFARSLHDNGYRVHVVSAPEGYARTTDPGLSNVFPFPDRIVRVGYGLTLGGLYLRLKRRIPRPPAGEPRTERAPAASGGTIRKDGNLLARLRMHLSAWDALPDQQRAWFGPAVRAGLELGRRERIDAVFASAPPWTGLRVAAKLSRKLRTPLIVDFRDPWTARTGRQTRYAADWCHKIAETWEKRVLERASLALFNSPQVMQAAQDHYETLETGRVLTIPNGSDAPRREVESPIPPSPPLHFRHFGTLYLGRSVTPLVRALQRLVERGVIEAGDVSVDLFGRVPEESKRLASLSSNPIHVETRTRLPYSDALALMMEPAILVVSQPAIVSRQIPTKLYDYLCTGNPVLVIAPERSAVWSLARTFPGCWRIEHADTEENTEALGSLLERWRSGCLVQRRTVEDTASLTKAALGEVFVSAIQELLAVDGQSVDGQSVDGQSVD